MLAGIMRQATEPLFNGQHNTIRRATVNRRDFLRTAGGAALATSLIGRDAGWANGGHEQAAAQPFRKGVWAQMREFLISPEQIEQRMDRLAEGGISLIVPGADKPGMLIPDGRRGVHWASSLKWIAWTFSTS